MIAPVQARENLEPRLIRRIQQVRARQAEQTECVEAGGTHLGEILRKRGSLFFGKRPIGNRPHPAPLATPLEELPIGLPALAVSGSRHGRSLNGAGLQVEWKSDGIQAGWLSGCRRTL